MSGSGFVHLHTHSEYSLLDGAARIEAPRSNPQAPTIFTEAVRHGMAAVAITDHGAMFGALRFYGTARQLGVKPIIGVEAYVAPGSRFDRTPGESEEKYHHLTLLAENEAGYRNLLKLVSLAHLEGFYHRPRMDRQLLAEHAEGLLCLSGCLSSELGVLLVAGRSDRAEEVAAGYRDIFGAENYFIELQDHGLADQRKIIAEQVRIARSIGVPIVATNDLHYIRKEDAKPHDVLLCIQQQKLQSDPKRLRFDSDAFYLKSAEEMRDVFRELPEACDQTLRIAERVELLPELERILVEQRTEYRLPRFDTPAGEPLEAYLRELVERGAAERYGSPLPTEVVERIDHELAVITKMGFAGYFLIVWDLIRFAREQGIRVGPGRGSAAGSVVSYSLRVTDLDPLRYGLLFERFLNADRVEMPDIDMDFDERRRDEVIRYATERYGSDRVAQIVTFQTIKGKQGIRDAARVLGFPPVVGDRLCKMYPPAVMGRDEPIDRALEISPELREAYEREPEAPRDRRHGAGARRPSPGGFRARGRRGDRRRAPRRVPPFEAHEGLAGRVEEDGHPVRHERRRAVGLAEDGLPRAADPLRDRGLRAASAQPRRRPRHRPRAARRRRDLRDAPAGRDHRRVPDGVAGRAQPGQAARARPLRGPDGVRRALPPGTAEQRPAHRVRRTQARAAQGHLPAPRSGGGARLDVRRHGLPGADHADRRDRGWATRWRKPTRSGRSWRRRSASWWARSAHGSWRAVARRDIRSDWPSTCST